ncbi:MAG: MFS transporter [Desulfobacteraceae bacterium A6]|nr:MAG: MFS transporter [Desulfobacteraceae bacterium A6]
MFKFKNNTDLKIIMALTLVHFTGDFYHSFISPLLPVLIQKYSLTLAQAGFIAGISRFLAFVVQPPIGYLADRYKTRAFVLGGPLIVVISTSLVGIAPSYAILLLLVSASSIGSSIFHPTTAGMISSYSGRNFAFSMSVFNMGGTLAFGLGPLFITWLVAGYGLEATPYTVFLGLASMYFLYKIIPMPVGEGLSNLGLFGSIKEIFGPVWKSIILLWLIMVLRAFVSQSFVTFFPVLYSWEGHSLVSIGLLVAIFTVAGSMSGLIAGHMADKMGFKPVFYITHLLTPPCMLLLLYLPGNWVYLGAMLAGFFVLATLPLGVTMAQKLAPGGKSMASSLMMGLAWGTGGVLTPVTGKLCDIFTIKPVLCVIAFIPFITLWLIRLLPKEEKESNQAQNIAP